MKFDRWNWDIRDQEFQTRDKSNELMGICSNLPNKFSQNSELRSRVYFYQRLWEENNDRGVL